MKFYKKYQEYMQGQEKKLPGLGNKNLKKILKKCRSDLQCHNGIDRVLGNQTCPDHCTGKLDQSRANGIRSDREVLARTHPSSWRDSSTSSPNLHNPSTARWAGVSEGAVPLEELGILLRRRCSEYWEERRQAERLERMRLIKQHWDNQTKATMGI